MIEITRLNGVKMVLNAELIETVEETPDTVITCTTGRKLIVKESRQEIKNLVISYKKEIYERTWDYESISGQANRLITPEENKEKEL